MRELTFLTELGNYNYVLHDGFVIAASKKKICRDYLQKLLKSPFSWTHKNTGDMSDDLLLKMISEGRNVPEKPNFILYGTKFQVNILKATFTIPYGSTCSYKDLALNAGYNSAYRAAGTALNKNPLPFIIPCHRVIRQNNTIGEFNGGSELKIKLIERETCQCMEERSK